MELRVEGARSFTKLQADEVTTPAKANAESTDDTAPSLGLTPEKDAA